jgi:hypothetical protein
MKKYTLSEYLKLKKMTQKQAALEIGISKTWLNLVLKGHKPLGGIACAKIYRWSGGRVNVGNLLLESLEAKICQNFNPKLSRGIDHIITIIENS